MSRAERRLAATELAANLRSQLDLWQTCTARLDNLEEQIDVCIRLLPQDDEQQQLSCVPLQLLRAKKVDYLANARIVISRLKESLDVATSLQAEETHVEMKLRPNSNGEGVKSKRKKNRGSTTPASSTIAATVVETVAPNSSDADSYYNVSADIVPDTGLECLSSATVTDIDEVIVSSVKTPLQLCTLINRCCKLLELVITQNEIFLNLSESNPTTSDGSGSLFEQIRKAVSEDEEALHHFLDEYVRSLSSTKTKTKKDQQEESLNDDSCNYTLDS